MKKTKTPPVAAQGSPNDRQVPDIKATASDKVTVQKEPTPTPPQAKKAIALPPIRATLELIRRGHREWLPRLREQLAAQPDIFRYVGDLGRQSQRAWADMVAGPDHLLRESLVLQAAERTELLAGRGASELEKLAAARIVAAEMEVEYLDLWQVQHPEADGTRLGEAHKKRYDEVDRRLQRAMKSLAEIKKLLPKTIEVRVLQNAASVPAAFPTQGTPCSRVLSGINGEHNGKINGYNRISGRLSGLMAPVGADG